MIGRIREVTGKPVGFKTVIGSPAMLDALFAEIMRSVARRRHPTSSPWTVPTAAPARRPCR